MRSYIVISLFIFTGWLAVTGCSKNNTLSNGMAAAVAGGSSNNNNFSATGTSVVATEKSVTTSGIPIVNLVITGTSLSGSAITLTVNGFDDSLAVFAINTYQVTASYTATTGAKAAASVSGTGDITITAVSPYLQGSFSFYCTDGTEVTNGTFTAKAP